MRRTKVWVVKKRHFPISEIPIEIIECIAERTTPETARILSYLFPIKFTDIKARIIENNREFINAVNGNDAVHIRSLLEYSTETSRKIIQQIQDQFNEIRLIHLVIEKGIKLTLRNFRLIFSLQLRTVERTLEEISLTDLAWYLCKVDSRFILQYSPLVFFNILKNRTKNIKFHIIFCKTLLKRNSNPKNDIEMMNEFTGFLLVWSEFLEESIVFRDEVEKILDLIYKTIISNEESVKNYIEELDQDEIFLESAVNLIKENEIVMERLRLRGLK